MQVIKRDGRKVEFNANRIKNAMIKAFEEVKGNNSELIEDFKLLCDKVGKQIQSLNKKELKVDDIQDIVESKLMGSKYKDIAKAYIRYRKDRDDARENTIDKTVMEITSGISDYWNNENSNKNAKLATTQRDYIAGAVSEDEALRRLLPKDIVEAHKKGIIHFHKNIVA